MTETETPGTTVPGARDEISRIYLAAKTSLPQVVPRSCPSNFVPDAPVTTGCWPGPLNPGARFDAACLVVPSLTERQRCNLTTAVEIIGRSVNSMDFGLTLWLSCNKSNAGCPDA